MAEKTIEADQLLAAGYGSHWQEVSSEWPQLASIGRKHLIDLAVSRAYLEMGVLPEAERHLRLLLQAERHWGNMTEIAFHDSLAYMLAEFYMGRILEQTGRKTEAVEAYQDFIRHFGNSNVHLAQVAETRVALKRLSGM
jgi:hypothetical protein